MDQTINALGTFNHTFDSNSARLRNVAYPNGVNVAFDYLAPAQDGRLKQIKNLLPDTSVLSQFDYAYSPVGNITRWDQTQAGVHKYYDLVYDPADELTQGILKDGTSNDILKPVGCKNSGRDFADLPIIIVEKAA